MSSSCYGWNPRDLILSGVRCSTVTQSRTCCVCGFQLIRLLLLVNPFGTAHLLFNTDVRSRHLLPLHVLRRRPRTWHFRKSCFFLASPPDSVANSANFLLPVFKRRPSNFGCHPATLQKTSELFRRRRRRRLRFTDLQQARAPKQYTPRRLQTD